MLKSFTFVSIFNNRIRKRQQIFKTCYSVGLRIYLSVPLISSLLFYFFLFVLVVLFHFLLCPLFSEVLVPLLSIKTIFRKRAGMVGKSTHGTDPTSARVERFISVRYVNAG